MSIIKKVMGNDFAQLHPMLQKRYALENGMMLKAQGIMTTIKGGPKWFAPLFHLGVKWKLLFPEHGQNIPFVITNKAYIDETGESNLHWERIFYFENNIRYFNANMSLDHSTNIIKDYLGEPALIYSDLIFNVTEEGFLHISSLNQRLVLGQIEIPIPKILQGLATVSEKYNDENKRYEISVTVKNPLIGTVFCYEGVFSINEYP